MKLLWQSFIGIIIGSIIGLCIFVGIHPDFLFAGEGGLNPGAVWDFLKTFPLDHPLYSFIMVYLAQKGGPIVVFLLHVIKSIRDGIFDDTEAAGALWRLAAIINGFWPNKSRKIILRYAPRHWHDVILEGKDPTFKLVAVPLNKLSAVSEFLYHTEVPGPTQPAGG